MGSAKLTALLAILLCNYALSFTPTTNTHALATQSVTKISDVVPDTKLYILKRNKNDNNNDTGNSNDTPGRRLMKQYSIDAPSPYDSIKKPAPKGDDSIQLSWFDNVKSSFWSTVDVFKPPEPDIEPKLRPLAKIEPTLPIPAPKEPPKDPLGNISPAIRESLKTELESTNPFIRLRAQLNAQQMQFQEDQRKAAEERRIKLEQFKEGVYRAGDAIKYTVDETAALPGKIADSVKRTSDAVQAIPAKVDNAVKQVQAIPGQVQERANKVKESVDNTVASTQKVVTDIQNIPKTVQVKVDETRQGYEKFQENVQQVATTGKVMLGLEKPVPKPPKTRPPTPNSVQKDATAKLDSSPAVIGLNIASSVVLTTAKAALWVGKGTIDLTVKGAQAALASAEKNKAAEATKISNERTTSRFATDVTVTPSKRLATTPPTVSKPPKTTTSAKAAKSSAAKPTAKAPKPPAPPKTPSKPKAVVAKPEPLAKGTTTSEESTEAIVEDVETTTSATADQAKSETTNKELEQEVADVLKLADDALKGIPNAPSSSPKK